MISMTRVIILNSRPYGGMHGDAGAEVIQVHLTSPLRIRCAMIRLNLLEVWMILKVGLWRACLIAPKTVTSSLFFLHLFSMYFLYIGKPW